MARALDGALELLDEVGIARPADLHPDHYLTPVSTHARVVESPSALSMRDELALVFSLQSQLNDVSR